MPGWRLLPRRNFRLSITSNGVTFEDRRDQRRHPCPGLIPRDGCELPVDRVEPFRIACGPLVDCPEKPEPGMRNIALIGWIGHGAPRLCEMPDIHGARKA